MVIAGLNTRRSSGEKRPMPDSDLFDGAKSLNKPHDVNMNRCTLAMGAKSSVNRKRTPVLTGKVRFFISFFEFVPLRRKKMRSVSGRMKIFYGFLEVCSGDVLRDPGGEVLKNLLEIGKSLAAIRLRKISQPLT